MRQRYIPFEDAKRAIWLSNFAAKMPQYAEKYRIEDTKQLQSDAAWFAKLVEYREQFAAFSTAITQYKNGIMDSEAPLQPLSIPTPSLPGEAQPGIFLRVASMVNKIKADQHYSEADGRDLGIVGAETPATDPATHKPQLSVRPAAGGHPELVWSKGSMGAIELQKMTDTGTWALLAIDTEPNYTDTTPLPAAGAAAVWKYRAIYISHDDHYGQWSDVVSCTVGG